MTPTQRLSDLKLKAATLKDKKFRELLVKDIRHKINQIQIYTLSQDIAGLLVRDAEEKYQKQLEKEAQDAP